MRAVERLAQRDGDRVIRINGGDRELLVEHVGKLPAAKLRLILAGIDTILGR